MALVFLSFVTCLIAYDSDARVSLYVGALWALFLAGGWALLKSRNPGLAARASGERRDPEGPHEPEYAKVSD